MKTTRMEPPNGILFVFDPTHKHVVVPPYTDGELTAHTETCVSVGTQAPIDGATDISLALSETAPAGLHQAWVGSVLSSGGKIAIVTAEFQILLELCVQTSLNGLSIWVDDLKNPGQVAVTVQPKESIAHINAAFASRPP